MSILWQCKEKCLTEWVQSGAESRMAWPRVGTTCPVPLPPPPPPPLSIWRCYITPSPPPRWSEANLPTPQCRILGIAAHRDAVMCHLALGPCWSGTLPDLSIKTRLPLRATSGRVSEGHLRRILPVMKTDQRTRLPRGRVATPLPASSSQQACDARLAPMNHTVADQRLSHLLHS